MASTPQYTELPERAQKVIENFLPDHDAVARRAQHFADTKPRAPDSDGSTEVLDDVTFTHHFIKTPGDYDLIEWHYVTCGQSDATPLVFLHGIPDSWVSAMVEFLMRMHKTCVLGFRRWSIIP